MKFPQFTRFFSANSLRSCLRMLLLGTTGAIVSINVVARSQVQNNLSLVNTLVSPWSSTSHTALAQTYWQEGKIDSALRELSVADDLPIVNSSDTSVLGAASFEDLAQTWRNEHVGREKKLAYWQDVANRYPTYRDGLLLAAIHSFELGNWSQSMGLLAKVEVLDPYNREAQQLRILLEEKEN